MIIGLTRDSVAIGDDCDAPHEQGITVAQGTTLMGLLQMILRQGYLPLIAGGQATWSVAFVLPLAVVAQQWKQPKLLMRRDIRLDELYPSSGTVALHFTYHRQQEPDEVFTDLSRLPKLVRFQ